MGYRVQGVLVRSQPDQVSLAEIERAYGYRLYEIANRGLWVLDLGVPEPKAGDRSSVRAARPLAPSYVDAVRVLCGDDLPLEQASWLTATSAVARQLGQPVLGFLSDDDLFDFAAVVTHEGVSIIADKVEPYLLRWENGALTIQPFVSDDPDHEVPRPPEELGLIPAVTLLGTEELPGGGYPLHGNVTAEMHDFAPAAADALGLLTWDGARVGSLRLVDARRLDSSCWDWPAGIRRDET